MCMLCVDEQVNVIMVIRRSEIQTQGGSTTILNGIISRDMHASYTLEMWSFGWSVARTEWKNTGVSREKKKEKSIQSRILPKQIKLCLLFWSLNQFPHLFIAPICRTFVKVWPSVAVCQFSESQGYCPFWSTHIKTDKQHNVVHFCIILGENVAFCPYVKEILFSYQWFTLPIVPIVRMWGHPRIHSSLNSKSCSWLYT